MSFAPCLIVPVYNHAEAFVQAIRQFPPEIPLIIVDDGNNAEQAAILAEMAKIHRAELIRLPENSGKWAAVLAGLRRAWELSFTHIIQVDADGQHNYSDIPKFFALSKDQPGAMLLGVPKYGDDIPASRRFGRHIANFFMRLETGDWTLKDAMCGFRLYPLKELKPLIDKGLVFQRMGGDIEFLVKAKWLGVPHLNIETSVIYPVGGVSNFRMLQDNIELIYLNTYLCTLAFFRLFRFRRNK